MYQFKRYGKEITRLLEDVERRIDPETEDAFNAEWHDFLYGKFTGSIFDPTRKKVSEPAVPFMNVHINDALEDYELMLIRHLERVSGILSQTHEIPGVCCEYNVGTMGSVFGADMMIMPRHTNTGPISRPIGTEKIYALLDKGIPDLYTGYGRRVFEMGEIYKDVLSAYPRISKYVHVYHPDFQGPIDTVDLLWGADMYYALLDEPEDFHRLLRLVTDTTAAMFDKWFGLHPVGTEMTCHYGRLYHRGRINLRMDTAMNLSPEQYREFVQPYHQELYERFGGGFAHFCGKGDHYIEQLSATPFLDGVQMTQPECNDMETIYRHTVDKGLKLFLFNRVRAKQDEGRPGGYSHNMNVFQ